MAGKPRLTPVKYDIVSGWSDGRERKDRDMNGHGWVDQNGLLQCDFITMGHFGHPIEKHVYVNGKRHGTCIKWHHSGCIKVLTNYRRDQLHGEYKWWYHNGIMAVNCTFVNGKRHGEYWRCARDGEVIQHLQYTYGIVVHNYLKPNLLSTIKSYISLW